MQNLEVLGVMKNEIYSLPSGIGHLKKLVEMNVDSNHLTGFPRELCNLQCLKELSASNNNLVTLPLGKSTSFYSHQNVISFFGHSVRLYTILALLSWKFKWVFLISVFCPSVCLSVIFFKFLNIGLISTMIGTWDLRFFFSNGESCSSPREMKMN